MSKTVLFHAIQFSINTLFSSIWPIDWTLSGATTPGFSGPGIDSNKEALCISQSSSVTGSSPSLLFSVIYKTLVSGVLLLGRDAVSVFCRPSRLGHRILVGRVLPLWIEAVSVFYSPSRLGKTRLGSFYDLSREDCVHCTLYIHILSSCFIVFCTQFHIIYS